MSGFGERYAAFDRFQRRHTWLAFALAVRQKYSDDQGGYLAATITYYAFFSIFPLLLVFVSVLGFVLGGHEHLKQTIVNSALGQFPVLGPDLKIHALRGNTFALVVGVVVALWSGMGIFVATENAMNHLWGVPFRNRPDFVRARLRGLGLLAALGVSVIGTTGLGAIGTIGASYGIAWKITAILVSTLLNIALFWTGFKLMTVNEITWRELRDGAIAAAVAYEGLQLVGGYYIGHVLKHATNVYGTFGLVIGLLTWIYLAVHVTLLAAEVNVVAKRQLWPRSFSAIVERPRTEADERALTQRAKVEERRTDEHVEVTFRDS